MAHYGKYLINYLFIAKFVYIFAESIYVVLCLLAWLPMWFRPAHSRYM